MSPKFPNYLLEPYDVRVPERLVIDDLPLHILINLRRQTQLTKVSKKHTGLKSEPLSGLKLPFFSCHETTLQHPTDPNLEAAPAIPKLKHERETKAQPSRETGTYLLAPLDVLDGDELLGPLVPDQPRHPEVAGPQLLQRLVPLLHQQRSLRPRPPKNGELATPSKRNLPAEKSQATNPNTQSQVRANSNQTRRDRIENSLGRCQSAVAAGRESDEPGRGFWSVGFGLGGQGTRGRR